MTNSKYSLFVNFFFLTAIVITTRGRERLGTGREMELFCIDGNIFFLSLGLGYTVICCTTIYVSHFSVCSLYLTYF